MKVELFPFQKQAVAELRYKSDQALKAYATTRVPQIVSLQAPTGSGKTVMMTALIENVLFGDTQHDEQPNAVFVWLSDSPNTRRSSRISDASSSSARNRGSAAPRVSGGSISRRGPSATRS